MTALAFFAASREKKQICRQHAQSHNDRPAFCRQSFASHRKTLLHKILKNSTRAAPFFIPSSESKKQGDASVHNTLFSLYRLFCLCQVLYEKRQEKIYFFHHTFHFSRFFIYLSAFFTRFKPKKAAFQENAPIFLKKQMNVSLFCKSKSKKTNKRFPMFCSA